MTFLRRRRLLVLAIVWALFAIAVARYGSYAWLSDPFGPLDPRASAYDGRRLGELGSACYGTGHIALGVSTVLVALARLRAGGARAWIWVGRLLALAWLAILPAAQYAGISNAGELYSGPGDDTGVWQYGSLLPWSQIPGQRVIFPYLAIFREPFVEFSIRARPLIAAGSAVEVRRWVERNLTGRPRRWDVIGTAVNTSVWLAAVAAVWLGLRHESRKKGAVPLDVAGVFLSLISAVLVLGTLSLVLIESWRLMLSAQHSLPRLWNEISFYLRPQGS